MGKPGQGNRHRLVTPRLAALFLLLLLVYMSGCGQHPEPAVPLAVTFTGDVMLARGVADELHIHGDSLLTQHLKPWFSNAGAAGYGVVNLEGVLGYRAAVGHDTVAGKRFRFLGRPELAGALYQGGVRYAGLANNHSADYGGAGLASTRQHIKQAGLVALPDRAAPAVINHGGYALSVSAANLLGGADSAYLHSLQQHAAANPSPLACYVHWGVEMHRQANPGQQAMARQLLAAGASTVIGHHPHVVQNAAYIHGKPVLYSLGNFVADAYLPGTTQALVARVMVNNAGLTVAVQPVDLTTYFPKAMPAAQAQAFLRQWLARSPGVALARVGQGQWWQLRPMQAAFYTPAKEWLLADGRNYQLHFKPITPHYMRLTAYRDGKMINFMRVSGKLSEVAMADIDHDGRRELLLGIAKPVHFDPQPNKRLNVFRVQEQTIIPVWLGTFMVNSLQHFRAVGPAHSRRQLVQTIEQDNTGQRFVCVYRWNNFGFELLTRQLHTHDHQTKVSPRNPFAAVGVDSLLFTD